jgi:hypothetical protein
MKTYGGEDVRMHVLLTLALVGSEWSPSRPSRLTAGEIVHSTRWLGYWLGRIADVDDMEK